jgi:hypothetical protein
MGIVDGFGQTEGWVQGLESGRSLLVEAVFQSIRREREFLTRKLEKSEEGFSSGFQKNSLKLAVVPGLVT